ncbi:MAG TPA: S8 family serine peptidase [Gammaproteobacteria bacterium]
MRALLLAALAVPAAGLDTAVHFHSAGQRIALAPVGGNAFALESGARVTATNRLIVRLRPGAPASVLAEAPAGTRVAIEEVISASPLRAVLRVGSPDPRAAFAVADALHEHRLVDYAVPEIFYPMELRSRHVPNDPLFPRQWPLDNRGQGGRVTDADVDAPEAWRYTRGSPDVVIAVLDDGVELDHPDLAPNISRAGRDFTQTPPGSDPSPRTPADRHGTAVAGVAAARGDNAIGVSGICPRCTILPLRVHGSSNLGTAAAFRYAVEQGADVITNSWGYSPGLPVAADDAVRDAIEDAAVNGRGGRGTLIVFGMTNDRVDNCRAPTLDISALDSVLAVGVSDHNDEIGGSGFGDCMDLVAPAKPQRRSTIGVATTDRSGLAGFTAGEYHTTFGGTSAAAPLVAGVAALLLSLNPDLTRAELVRILEHTADKIDPAAAAYDANGFSAKAGHGRLNAERALLPTARIRVVPDRVKVGQPFTVVVTASAPFGVESVSWRGLATGVPALDEPHRDRAGGTAYHEAVWRDVVADRPGVFVLRADARDARHALADGYPHEASRAGGAATATIAVAADDASQGSLP